jgi:hypothetical protein
MKLCFYGFPFNLKIDPHPVSTLELKLSGWYWCLGLIRDVIRKEPYNILYVCYSVMEIKQKKKRWWYRYQSRQTNTVVMFFQYYICKFPLFSTKYMINTEYYMSKSVSHAVSTREPYIKGMVEIYDIMNITCQNLYHMPYQPSTYITPRVGGPWGNTCILI